MRAIWFLEGCRKPLKMLHQPCLQYTDSPIPSWRKFVTCALCLVPLFVTKFTYSPTNYASWPSWRKFVTCAFCLVPLFVTKFTYSPTNYAWSTSHVLTLSFDQGDIANYFPQSQLLDMFAGHVKALMYRMCNPKHPEAHSINSHRRNNRCRSTI